MSRLVRGFFLHNSPLRVTTNGLRSLTATRFTEAQANGVISSDELRSAHAVNGHTGTTSRDYYVKQSRLQDAINAQQAWKKVRMTEPPMTPVATTTSRPIVATGGSDHDDHHATVTLHGFGDWGRNHPAGKAGVNVRRAEWTAEELDWISNWLRTNVGDSISAAVGSSQCHIRRCLDDIIRTKTARRIFHPLHVADSGRLRHGFRKILSSSEKEW